MKTIPLRASLGALPMFAMAQSAPYASTRLWRYDMMGSRASGASDAVDDILGVAG